MAIDDHHINEDGLHYPDECAVCIEKQHATLSSCRCGNCCEATIIEVSLRDAEREPRIRECSEIIDDNLGQGPRELIGYLLNDPENGYACRFFDRTSRLCTIHETRPLCCRVFDCDEYEYREKPA